MSQPVLAVANIDTTNIFTCVLGYNIDINILCKPYPIYVTCSGISCMYISIGFLHAHSEQPPLICSKAHNIGHMVSSLAGVSFLLCSGAQKQKPNVLQ